MTSCFKFKFFVMYRDTHSVKFLQQADGWVSRSVGERASGSVGERAGQSVGERGHEMDAKEMMPYSRPLSEP